MGEYSNHLHETYRTILQERGKRTLEPPLWKLRISDDEYTELQLVLQEAERSGNLLAYGPEAAICYAEWWRRNYHGGFPSKESVASDLGVYDSEMVCVNGVPFQSARIITRHIELCVANTPDKQQCRYDDGYFQNSSKFHPCAFKFE